MNSTSTSVNILLALLAESVKVADVTIIINPPSHFSGEFFFSCHPTYPLGLFLLLC